MLSVGVSRLMTGKFMVLVPVLGLALSACHPENTLPRKPLDAAFIRLSPKEVTELPETVRFDAPMGTESGAFTYNAQRFRVNRHLGDDLNGIGGWNSDLGDPVYASGAGKVLFAGWVSAGWGNMVILGHRVPDATAPMGYRVYQTIYAHLDEILTKYGDVLPRGKQLGTVGTANGKYLAHLHFEVRESLSVYPGIGYADAPLDRVPPEAFLKRYRGKSGEVLVPGVGS